MDKSIMWIRSIRPDRKEDNSHGSIMCYRLQHQTCYRLRPVPISPAVSQGETTKCPMDTTVNARAVGEVWGSLNSPSYYHAGFECSSPPVTSASTVSSPTAASSVAGLLLSRWYLACCACWQIQDRRWYFLKLGPWLADWAGGWDADW